MPAPVIALFCMPEQGHIQRCLPVIHSITRRGVKVYVCTERRFSSITTRSGGIFVDIFKEGPLEDIDHESIPIPSRYVTFAACRGKALAERIGKLSPTIIVYDTFAVIARVIAHLLKLPAVNICAGHALVPERALAAMAFDERVHSSRACLEAATFLQSDFGISDASPFSYLSGLSSLLNLYGEPPQYLSARDRSALEPIGFFGSLLPELYPPAGSAFFQPGGMRKKVYISFGSVTWRYFSKKAERLIRSLAAEMSKADIDMIISTSGYKLSPETSSQLDQFGCHVHGYVNQWSILQEADVFVTHQGLNSSHEAIWHGVPMLSCPFFSDQPQLAERCRALGLALLLCPASDEDIAPGAVRESLATLQANADVFRDRLAQARDWEMQTIAGREGLIERVLELA